MHSTAQHSTAESRASKAIENLEDYKKRRDRHHSKAIPYLIIALKRLQSLQSGDDVQETEKVITVIKEKKGYYEIHHWERRAKISISYGESTREMPSQLKENLKKIAEAARYEIERNYNLRLRASQ